MRPLIITLWLLALLAVGLFVAYDYGLAGELSADVSLGASYLNHTAVEGTWCQSGNGCNWSPYVAPGYRVGLTYDLDESNGVSLYYWDLGALKLDARYGADSAYNVKSKTCLIACGNELGRLVASDRLRGIVAMYTRKVPLGDWIPSARIGLGGFRHDFTVSTFADRPWFQQLHSVAPMIIGGLALEYKPLHLYTEFDYLQGLSIVKCGDACLSESVVTVQIGIKIPLGL